MGFGITHDARWAFETGAAALTKAVWWDLRLSSRLTHLFIYFYLFISLVKYSYK